MKIVLYSQEHCGMCKAVHMQLDKINVTYENTIITQENIDKYKAEGIMSTPTLVIDDDVYIGTKISEGINRIRTQLGR